MMIAALHLQSGDRIVDLPSSDEPGFDYENSFRTAATADTATLGITVSYTEIRSSGGLYDTRGHRFVALDDGAVRSWRDERLVEVVNR